MTLKKKEFHEKLVTIVRWVKELKVLKFEEKTLPIRQHKMKGLMDDILEVYLMIQVDSNLKSDPLFQDYLNESANLFYGAITADIHLYIRSIERIAGSILEPGEWEKVCWRRSAIEALKELYKNTVFEQYFYEIETDDDLDERLEFLSEREGPVSKDDIPKGIPSSHWWWWGEPPEESDDD